MTGTNPRARTGRGQRGGGVLLSTYSFVPWWGKHFVHSPVDRNQNMTDQRESSRNDRIVQRDSDVNELEAYVRENRNLLARMLAHGDAEARGYALAVIANGGRVEDIEQVQRELDRLKNEVKR